MDHAECVINRCIYAMSITNHVQLSLVVVVNVHMLEVPRPCGRRVEPLLDGLSKLVVEDGDGVFAHASLE